jgi:peptide/nickel transport system permease protein
MDRVMQLQNLILPMITLGIRPLAIIVQLTRSSMLDVLSQDFIRTAIAKGVKYKTVLFKHALRNALNPVVTAISGWFASLMAGAFFVEYVFDWKGIGLVAVKSLMNSDFPVVMGVVIMTATVFVVINIIVDIMYGILDPRVSIKS